MTVISQISDLLCGPLNGNVHLHGNELDGPNMGGQSKVKKEKNSCFFLFFDFTLSAHVGSIEFIAMYVDVPIEWPT